MVKRWIAGVLLAMSGAIGPSGQARADAQSNADLVRTAMVDLFAKRDPTAVGRYWSDHYIQHNPGIADGSSELPDIVKALPSDFRYEPGMVVAQGDLVMIHGRYVGWGPKPLVAVDIFRVQGGKLVEHWDVLQDEVPAGKTKSGHPMFRSGQ